MKCGIIFTALALALGAEAHTRVWAVHINNVDQGDGRDQYIRSPPTNNPLKDVNQASIKCNVNDRQVGRWVNAKAGDQITFEWYHNSRGDDIIDKSHKGPLLLYVSPSSSGYNSWTKVAEEGLNNGVWAVDKLIQNRGKVTYTIPSSLPAGDYIFRNEIIALHEANVAYAQNQIRGAQFYPACAQIRITSGGTGQLPNDLRFPGAYKPGENGIVFDLYTKPLPPSVYPVGGGTFPGGPVWRG